MSELIERVGVSVFVQIILEGWNELFLLLLIVVMQVGKYRDNSNELVSKVKIPLTGELVIFYSAIFVYNLANIITLIYGGHNSPSAYYVMRIGVFCYYLVGAFQTVFFLDVIKSYIARKNGDKRLERVIIGFQLIEVLNVLLLIATPFTNALYSIDAANEYNRSWGYYVWQGITIVTFLFIGVAALLYRKQNDRFVKRIIAIAFLFPMAGFLMSIAYPGFNFNNIMVSIAELLLFMLYEKNKTDVTLKYGYELEKAKTELAESRLAVEEAKSQTLMAQIQPHFINNSLMAIRARCFDHPEIYDSITDFSRYLRSNFEALGDTRLILFEQEMDNIEAYLSLEKANFGDRLRVEYDIDFDDFLVPALSVQPLVENAVRHGVGTYDKGGTVTISVHRDKGNIIVEVRDEGLGRKEITEQQSKRRGIGVENVRKRMKYMTDGRLDIFSSEQGTTARLTIADPQMKRENSNNDNSIS